MQCRFGLDCNLLVCVLTLATVALIYAVDSKKTVAFCCAGILFGISYYCYALSYIPTTIMLIIFGMYLLYTKYSKKLILQLAVGLYLPVVIFGLPLVAMLVVNMFDLPEFSFLGMTITKLHSFRAGEFTADNIFFHIKDTIKYSALWDFIRYNSFVYHGTMFMVSFPFIIIGGIYHSYILIKSLIHKEYTTEFFWFITYISYFVNSIFLGGGGTCVNKLNGLFFAQFILVISGIRITILLMKKYIPVGVRAAKIGIAAVYLISAVAFLGYYFIDYPTEYPFVTGYSDLYEKTKNEDKVYFDSIDLLEPVIYYLYSSEISPYEAELDMWPSTPEKFKNVNFIYEFSGSIDEDGVYIVQKQHDELQRTLKGSGFYEVEAEGSYLLFKKTE